MSLIDRLGGGSGPRGRPRAYERRSALAAPDPMIWAAPAALAGAGEEEDEESTDYIVLDGTPGIGQYPTDTGSGGGFLDRLFGGGDSGGGDGGGDDGGGGDRGGTDFGGGGGGDGGGDGSRCGGGGCGGSGG
jgi:hypothetical protein